MTGSIPSLTTNTNLQGFWLDYNQLTGSIPSLSTLSHLNALDLSNNSLNGNIPDLSGITNMQWFNLSENQLTGSIPNPSAMTELLFFRAYNNDLTGSIPSFSANTKMEILNLSGNQLTGAIPDFSANVKLQFLDLSNNQLTGGIPSLSALTDLLEIHLQNNPLGGAIPSLSALTKVVEINFSQNQLTGNIPSLAALANLEYLYLQNNTLTGNVPDPSALTKLQIFALNQNQFTGTIPSLSTLSQLKGLYLDNNQLTGSIPSLAANTQLNALSLSQNQLSGTIPSLSGLTVLEHLYLYDNQLISVIPASITDTSLAYGQLGLCGGANIIVSSDPAVITWVQDRDPDWVQGCGIGVFPLANEDLGYNTPKNTPLTIAAPGVLGNDTPGNPAAVLASFGGDSLGGAVTDHAAGTTVSPLPGYGSGSLQVNADGGFVFTPPTGFVGDYTFQYRLSNIMGTSDAAVTIPVIQVMDCSDTATTGVPQTECEALIALFTSTNGSSWTHKTNWNTPSSISTWYGVTVTGGHVSEIELSENNLSGPIPNLSALAGLQKLDLRGNQLTGTIPAELGSLTTLLYLDLGRNQLTGTIPTQLGSLTLLTRLWLDENQLSGSIPPELGNLTNMESMNLAVNNLTGSLPVELANMTGITLLMLDTNALSGSIPPEYGQLTSLDMFWLYSNQLTGSIPAQLNNLTLLTDFRLCDNHLSGSIPDLSGLTNLQRLELRGNQLSGPIPTQLGSLTKLTFLDLGHNQLTGPIPPELGNLTQLTYLWLDENLLSGSIPPELGNLTNMESMNLAVNGLSGNLPVELANLTHMYLLMLDTNALSGSIPSQYGQLTALNMLWLNSNQLTGTIPTQLNNLVSLTSLNLDHNQLIGTLPALTGLTQLQSLNVGYNQLVSVIPPSITGTAIEENQLTLCGGDNIIYTLDPAVTTWVQARDYGWSQYCSLVAPTLSVNDVTVNESAGTATFTVNLSEASAKTVTVIANTSNGTAAAPGDYTAVVNQTVTFAPGVTSQPVSVTIINDTAAEASETFTLNLSHSANALIADAQGVGTITLNDLVPLVLGSYQETEARLIYSGVWKTWTGSGPSGGAFKYTTQLNDSITFSFQGTGVVLYRTMDPNRGMMQVCVDGACTTVNNYSATRKWSQSYSRTGFAAGLHTVTVTHLTNGKVLDLDAVAVQSVLPVGVHQENQAALTYVGTWKTWTGSGPSGGAFKYTTQQNANVRFQFAGNGLILYRTMDPNRGQMKVCIDGTCTTINNYRATRQWAAPYAVTRLNNALHTVIIVNPSTTVLDLDALRLMGPLQPGNHEENNLNIVYSGTWKRWTGTGPSSGAFLYTNQVNANLWFQFSGQAITIYRTMDPNRGQMRVCVDSTCTTINNYRSTRLWAAPHTITNLAAGVHTVTITHLTSGKVTDLDRVQVYAAPPAVPEMVAEEAPTATATLAPTATFTPTSTATATVTMTPTLLPTETLIPEPMQTIESDLDLVGKTGSWTTYAAPEASGGQYIYSSGNSADTLMLSFTGTRVDVVYVQHPALGSFAIEIDGVLAQVIDSASESAVFGAQTSITGLADGSHLLRIYPISGTIAIDAFAVQPQPEPTPTSIPTDIPTTEPTWTPLPTDIVWPTDVPTQEATLTPLPTDIPTDVPTETPLPTDIPTEIPTETPVPTATFTETPVPTDTPLPTDVPTTEPLATEEPAA